PYLIKFDATGSADTNYTAAVLPANISMVNDDNDTAGFAVATQTQPLHTTESGGTATFSVVLVTQPSGNVTVNFHSDTPLEGKIGASASGSLVFTNANWSAPQVATVTGQNDNPPVQD